jgi:hypothetical protein
MYKNRRKDSKTWPNSFKLSPAVTSLHMLSVFIVDSVVLFKFCPLLEKPSFLPTQILPFFKTQSKSCLLHESWPYSHHKFPSSDFILYPVCVRREVLCGLKLVHREPHITLWLCLRRRSQVQTLSPYCIC